MRATPSVDVNDPDFIRVKYIRYCDDWLIGVCGPYALAQQIKEEIKTFLREQLQLTLSEEKTHITNAKKGQAKFLGTLITIGRGGQQKITKVKQGTRKMVKRRTTGWETIMEMPTQDLIQRLHKRGFCTANGEPTTKVSWMNLDPEQTISLYRSINQGILNYYRFVDNVNGLVRIQYILQYSLAKTFAAKYRISVRKVFTRFGKNITVVVKAQDGKKDRYVSFNPNKDWEKRRNDFKINDKKIDLVQMALRMHTRSKLGKPCCICGSSKQVENHHVRHIRKIKHKETKGFKRIMQSLNRKQVPVCKSCHIKIHQGKYDGLKLSDLVYDPR